MRTVFDPPEFPRLPAICLITPKFSRNVAGVLRAASCFDAQNVCWTGDRIDKELEKYTRLPREERMRGYNRVDLFRHNRPFDFFSEAEPVCVEVRPGSISLPDFIHPENALYVFGPEDGTLPRHVAQHCRHFVSIPTRHCLNLAACCYVVLYDRLVKSGNYTHISSSLMEDRWWTDFENEKELSIG